MAFGGYFNPNYTMLPQQQGQSPQLPPQPQFTPMQPPQMPKATQPGLGDMPFMTMPFMGMPYMGYGMPYGMKPPPADTKPSTAPQVPVAGQPPVTNTQPTPVSKPGYDATAKPGMSQPPPTPLSPPPIQPAGSAEESGQNWMNQYNSPEYAAWYNSLAPSTRAFARAPGNADTGQYLYNQGYSNYQSFGNNTPWTSKG